MADNRVYIMNGSEHKDDTRNKGGVDIESGHMPFEKTGDGARNKNGEPKNYAKACDKYPGLKCVIEKVAWDSISYRGTLNDDEWEAAKKARDAIYKYVESEYCPSGFQKDMWDKLGSDAKKTIIKSTNKWYEKAEKEAELQITEKKHFFPCKSCCGQDNDQETDAPAGAGAGAGAGASEKSLLSAESGEHVKQKPVAEEGKEDLSTDERDIFKNPRPEEIDPGLWKIMDKVTRERIREKLYLVKPHG
jgi:hypothetical protein